jgi:hypothetical protein
VQDVAGAVGVEELVESGEVFGYQRVGRAGAQALQAV